MSLSTTAHNTKYTYITTQVQYKYCVHKFDDSTILPCDSMGFHQFDCNTGIFSSLQT